MYEGRWADAEKLLKDGIAADEKSNDRLARAAKLTALAELYLAQNRAPQAVRAAQDAMSITREDVDARVAQRSCSSAPGGAPKRRPSPSELGQTVSAPQSRLRRHRRGGDCARRRPLRRCQGRVRARSEARRPLARAVPAGRDLHRGLASTCPRKRSSTRPRSVAARRRQSFSTTCRRSGISRRCRYWLGRAQEGINKASPAAAENYRKFLALRPDSRDPLAADARKRLAGLSPPR